MQSFKPFLSLLGSIPDPRRAEGKRYTQAHILFFSILAIVTGANSYRGIRTLIKVHHARLNAAFGLSWKRPPAHTSIRTILTGLNAADLETAFRAHAADLDAARSAKNAQRTIALDGKVLRGSFDAFHDRRVQQMPSAFATDTMLVLAHVDIDDKSNEIPAVQALLQDLDVSRHIVTLDAMHCQKTFEAASSTDTHLIIQLKNNQKALRHAVIAACAATTPLSSTRTCDKNRRNRQDTRTATVFEAAALDMIGWKNHINAIIRVERDTRTFLPSTGCWKRSNETAYYLSNKPIAAKVALQAIRDHWGIENQSHYVRDVTLREDASRIRHKPGLFARLRSFAINLLRFNQADTIAQDRYAAALSGFDALNAMQFIS